MNHPFAIMRLKKHKPGKTMRAAADHMVRQRATPNADPARINRWLTTQIDPCQAVQERLEEAGVKVRKNGVHAIEFLLTASPEYFRPENPEKAGCWDKERLEAWVPEAMGWLHETFGQENVVASVLHQDEATPHISAFVVPIVPTENGAKLSAKHWCDGRRALAKLQDGYAQAVQRLGLRRGIRGSMAKHVRISQYYGAMNATQGLKLVPITPPPRFIINPDAWAEAETKRIGQIYARQTRPARDAQEELAIAKRQMQEARTTLTRLKGYERVADKVRDIPLPRVAEALGLAPVPGDTTKFKGDNCTLSLTTSQFYDHLAGKGGGGAIDLVMHVTNASFQEAVGWLADAFSLEAATAASMAHRLNHAAAEAKAAQAAPERPYLPPVRNPACWPHVREWLIQTRGMPARLVDHIHDKGGIYADAKGNFCALGPACCCEIKGTGPVAFTRLATGSKPTVYGSFRLRTSKDPARLVLVESALDAMAYADQQGLGNEIVSTAGARGRLPWAEAEAAKGREIWCAYDNDEAGDKVFQALCSTIPSIRREIPQGRFKDWNDLLLALRAERELAPSYSMR